MKVNTKKKNKYLEYLKLIPKGILNISSIIEGIINNVELNNESLSEELKSEIIRRRCICIGCPFNSKNATTSSEYFELYNSNYTTDRNDEHCCFCGCPIDIRTGSLSTNCGIEEWNEENKNVQMKLKWSMYEEKI
jgi:hypothetical protein